MNLCETCKFFDAAYGECRKSPPIRLPRKFAWDATPGARKRDEELIFGWPAVKRVDWCGEHKNEA